ncbi:hypothetical protein KSP39_PZI007620 [Platanthera zijinensis]|uniref:DUF632 domain-containing protein n=1 Tax=Platanthera zijinensis TaxID=2320716 RepID=A0AAP0BN32_9ASPA
MEACCGYFFQDMPMSDYEWDFFNPFERLGAAGMTGGLGRSSDEDLRVVREQEGIPELEDVDGHEEKREFPQTTLAMERKGKEEKKIECAAVVEKKMELLDALKDVEDEFIKAFDSGKELARMLEANVISVQPVDNQIKENSSKFIQAITWHRSPASLSSSSRRSLGSYQPTECRSELFDDYVGMGSGSHSQTLGRLYAWEKKLYEEVKAEEQIRQMYEKKRLQLRNHDSNGQSHTADKSRAALKDLYARICVALRTIETISLRIQKVQDDELHPQIIELLQGHMRAWRVMLQSHERQKQIMDSVKAFTCPSYGRYCSDSQRQVTKTLEEQIENWRACFKNYVVAQRSYVEVLYGWHSKFFVPDITYYSMTGSSALPCREGPSPLLSIVREWANSSRRLPDMAVSCSTKGLVNEIRCLYTKQGEEQLQKRKVDGLAKEFDQKIMSLQKADYKILEFKRPDLNHEHEVQDRAEYLAERKHFVDILRQKLDAEKTKHQSCMQETTQVTLNAFKSGFSQVFESLTEFSRDSLNLYTELLAQIDRAVVSDISVMDKRSCIEDLNAEVDVR